MTWPFGDVLRPLSCDVIVADPPWDFENYSEKGTAKGADPHYAVMPLDDIKALPVGQLAGGCCILLLWTCGWAMANGAARAVCLSWGFRPVSEIVWIKRTRRGKHRPGTGYRVRTMHEPIIFGTIGEQRHKPFPSAFDGIAREHSRKPDEFYEIVLKCTPNAMRRADLFCDRRIDGRPGFIGWGKPHRGVAA